MSELIYKPIFYTLIKNWPNSKLSTNIYYIVYNNCDFLCYMENSNIIETQYNKDIVINYPEYFLKYNKDNYNLEYTIKTNTENIDIIISKYGIHIGTTTLNINHIKDIYNSITKQRKINKWSINVETLTIGCRKGIHINSIKEIIDIYNTNFYEI